MKNKEKKYELTTVKLSNEGNKLTYPKATKANLDLLALILAKGSQKANIGKKELTIAVEEIIKTLDYPKELTRKLFQPKNYEAFIKKFFNDFCSQIFIYEEKEHRRGIYSLFQGLEYKLIDRDIYFEDGSDNNKQWGLKVIFSDKANELIYNLGENNPYFKFKLQDYVKINSKYSKRVFQLLTQYKKLGQYKISSFDFFNLLSISKGYKDRRNLDKLLNQIKADLIPSFPNLKIEKIHGEKNKIQFFVFKWKTNLNEHFYDDQESETKRNHISLIKAEEYVSRDEFSEQIKKIYEVDNYLEYFKKKYPDHILAKMNNTDIKLAYLKFIDDLLYQDNSDYTLYPFNASDLKESKNNYLEYHIKPNYNDSHNQPFNKKEFDELMSKRENVADEVDFDFSDLPKEDKNDDEVDFTF